MGKVYEWVLALFDWATTLNIWEIWLLVAAVLLSSCVIVIAVTSYLARSNQMKETLICFGCLRPSPDNVIDNTPCPDCGCTVKIKKWRY